jgi:hypothetical protein
MASDTAIAWKTPAMENTPHTENPSVLDALPDGIVAFVKRDCPTCELVAPLLVDLAGRDLVAAVVTQDDPTFPDGGDALGARLVDDTELAASWAARIDTVPTLIRRRDGEEVERLEGWDVERWRTFVDDALPGTDSLPPYRPGCGSLSVDPDRVAALEARYGDGLASARVELASAEDPFEAMYDRGWSDGLPLVPPTPERVAAMLAGTTRAAGDIVAIVPPDLVECTVEKVAINAVMAGCRPEYLPVVLAAIEAICTDEFNIHGVLATTMPVGPVLIVNGPIRRTIGMNSGTNALGQGNRANSTIGRAVQLVVRNVGGGVPGGVDRATLGNPGKVGFCFAEDEEGSPFEPLSVARGFAPGTDTVTVFAGEGPRCVVDQLTRDADGLARSLAMALNATTHPKLVLGFDAVLVLSPEHAARFADAGWSRERVIETIVAHTIRPADTILRGVDGVAEGVPERAAGTDLPKVRPDGGLLLVHAGGEAGLFSAIIGGWVTGATGSRYLTREITP